MYHSSDDSTRHFPSATALAALALAVSIACLPLESTQLVAAGLLVGLLCGAGRRAALGRQARRLGRFVSPNVAFVVRRRGIDSIRSDSRAEISIICADLRNFTRFSSAVDSAQAMQLLREYYDAVGDAVARFGGTVKDYAGDGILVLVGAPKSVADHADRAVNMARAIREAAQEVTSRWSREGLELGIGVGVASGEVTVGVVGGAQRMEYAAVGSAVNLAARLCGKAGAGEILIDERTRVLARRQKGRAPGRAGAALRLKGIPAPVASFVV